jgi:transcriptional regulator with XRE-family HTH domain
MGKQMMDYDVMRDRVRRRLSDLGTSPITVAKTAGLERGFINDFLIGKKKTVRGAGLEAMAAALDCDTAFLTGDQEEPRQSPGPAEEASQAQAQGAAKAGVLPIKGVAEAGVWRAIGQIADDDEGVFFPFDPRRPGERFAFRARGNAAHPVGIDDGEVVLCLGLPDFSKLFGGLRDGALCVVTQTKPEIGLQETAIRQARVTTEGVSLVQPGGRDAIPIGAGRIEGVVERAVRLFM